MSPSKSKKARPWLTEDVLRKDQIVTNNTWISNSIDDTLLDLSKAWKKVQTINQFKTEIKSWLHDKLLEKIYDLRGKMDRAKLIRLNKADPKIETIDTLFDFFPKKVNDLADFKVKIKAWLEDKLIEKIYEIWKRTERLKLHKLIKE